MRREWRTGSVYRHGDFWRVAFSLGLDREGRRIRKEWQCRTEKAARAKLSEVNRRLGTGLPLEESRVRLNDYAQEWLAAVKPTVRPSTFAFYRTLAEVHLEDLGPLPVVRIGPADIRELVSVRLAEGYAPRTVRAILDVLRMILKQAVNDGIIPRNVAELVTPPKLEQAEPRHFTAEQARKFMEVCRDDPLGSFYIVALGTGLRRSELLGLTWRDVDLDVGNVAVRRSKTAAGVRNVPLPTFGREALGLVERKPGPIWQVNPTTVSKRMAPLCDKAGVPRLTLHGLRHTFASLALDSGTDPLTLQALMGHTRVSMTGFYARAGEERRREAVESLGRMIG
jgi:integrase